MSHEGERPRDILRYLRRDSMERRYPRIDTAPLIDTLDRLGIGYPITFSVGPYLPLQRIGYVIPLDATADFVCMNNGRMQIRKTKDEVHDWPNQTRTLAQLQHHKSFDTAEEAREYFLTYRRERVQETVITNNERRHKGTFVEALGKVKKIVDDKYAFMKEQSDMLDAIVPQADALGDIVQMDERLKGEQARVIDMLAAEKLGKAIVTRRDDEVIGYALPVPAQEGEDPSTETPSRQLILLKNGRVVVVDIPEGSSHTGEYTSREIIIMTPSETEFEESLEDSAQYAIVTSNDSRADKALLEESYAAAVRHLQQLREDRRSHVASAPQTRRFLAEAQADVTEPTIEEQAREILGRDFLGVEAVRQVEAYLSDIGKTETFDLENVPEIPYSVRDLELAKQNGEMLVLRPQRIRGRLGVIEDLSLTRLVDLFNQTDGIPQPRIFKATEILTDFPNLARTDDIQLGWALVKKELLNTSKNKTVEQQDLLLHRYGARLREMDAEHFDVRRRTGVEAAWDCLIYFINNGIRLLPNERDLTSTDAFEDKPVGIGLFGENGLLINHNVYGRLAFAVEEHTGVCSTR